MYYQSVATCLLTAANERFITDGRPSNTHAKWQSQSGDHSALTAITAQRSQRLNSCYSLAITALGHLHIAGKQHFDAFCDQAIKATVGPISKKAGAIVSITDFTMIKPMRCVFLFAKRKLYHNQQAYT